LGKLTLQRRRTDEPEKSPVEHSRRADDDRNDVPLDSNLPRFLHVARTLNADAVDFARGLLIGLSIGFNLLAAWMYGRNRRCAG
jgi:hypothetical protein